MPKSARDSQRNEKERKPFCTCLRKNALVTSEGGCLRGKRAVVSSGARRICRAATTTAPITSVAWVKLDPSDWRRGRMTLRLLVCATRHQVVSAIPAAGRTPTPYIGPCAPGTSQGKPPLRAGAPVSGIGFLATHRPIYGHGKYSRGKFRLRRASVRLTPSSGFATNMDSDRKSCRVRLEVGT